MIVSDIFTTPLEGGGGKDPPNEWLHPLVQCDFFGFLMFLNLNLRFAHVDTPPKHLPKPPQFQIPRNNPDDSSLLFSC